MEISTQQIQKGLISLLVYIWKCLSNIYISKLWICIFSGIIKLSLIDSWEREGKNIMAISYNGL